MEQKEFDEKYNKILLGITKEGEWYLYEGSEDMLPDDKWLDGKITKEIASASLLQMEIDDMGLDNIDNKMIMTMIKRV